MTTHSNSWHRVPTLICRHCAIQSNVVEASTNEFVPAADEVLLKGKSTGGRWNSPTNSVHVEYGLERFYVAEGTGNPTGKLTAQVVVPASGRGRVKEVFVDGKPYAEAMKGAER